LRRDVVLVFDRRGDSTLSIQPVKIVCSARGSLKRFSILVGKRLIVEASQKSPDNGTSSS
jgi:hypothetical protein